LPSPVSSGTVIPKKEIRPKKLVAELALGIEILKALFIKPD
jgi:hypothetical protein